ncbi:MAG: slipin family protein [Spirochaetales bacterium]|nr:slipin family protein [Spirochaetales bacterium]
MIARIKNDERGLLFKDGNYIKRLGPGKHGFFSFSKYSVILCDVNEPFKPENRNLNLFLQDEELKKELHIIEVKDHEVALHFEDGLFREFLYAGRYAYWNVLKEHAFIMIDRKNPEITGEIDPALMTHPGLAPIISAFTIESYEKGLLFFDGIYKRTLDPGKHAFWNLFVSVAVKKVDLRQQQIDMAGQEIMTQDKVALRLNFICHYKITDPEKVLLEIKSAEEQVYILLQLILREYVGTWQLDDLLKKKEEIGQFVLERLKEKSGVFGIEFLYAGVKDIILPGEIKDILNMVLIAEKKAQANLITRREETASTRSLLNTVKLMEDNPTLYKLKELEYIEKICEKIGNISLLGGSNLIEGLKTILGMK